MNENDKEKLSAWVTGASKGIGLAITKELLESGIKTALSASSSNSFADLPEEIMHNPDSLLFPFNITNFNEIYENYNRINDAVDGLDILVNNAGVATFAEFKDISTEQFRIMNQVNFEAVFHCTKAALSGMLERKFGIIVNILSGAVVKTFTYSSVYSATKAAVLAMSKSMREEVRKDGVKIINILPGATLTDIWDEEMKKEKGDVMLTSESVAKATMSAIFQSLTPGVMIEDVLLRPQGGDL